MASPFLVTVVKDYHRCHTTLTPSVHMEETSVAKMTKSSEPIPREPNKYCFIFSEADLQYRCSLSTGNERFGG